MTGTLYMCYYMLVRIMAADDQMVQYQPISIHHAESYLIFCIRFTLRFYIKSTQMVTLEHTEGVQFINRFTYAFKYVVEPINMWTWLLIIM